MTKICPHCKAGNTDTNPFCYTCGKDISKIEPTSGKYKPPKNPKLKVKSTSKKHKPSNNPKLKGNLISRWWSRQSQNNKYGLGIFATLLAGVILVLIVGAAVSLTEKPEVTQTVTDTPTTAEPNPAVNSSLAQSEEDSYKQWLKEDYQQWDKAQSSPSYGDQLYNLYTGAQAKNPPEKYREFHQHYVKDYYYLYMAQKAAENNNIDDVGYYEDLASAEYNKMLEYMPDYMQVVTG
jgi:hypothetical protein